MNQPRFLRPFLYSLALFLLVSVSPSINAQSSRPRASFELDGVRVGIAGSFNPGSKIHTSAKGDLTQVAYSVAWRPYREISIITVPFGIKPGAEAVPVAGSGATGSYEEALQAFRQSQGGIPQYAPTINIFGHKAVGISNVVSLTLDGPKPKSISITEWVVEAGNRMWIVRVSQEVKDRIEGEKAGDNLADLALTSDETLKSRSLLIDALSREEASRGTSTAEPGIQQKAAGDLPAASWWNGNDCDSVHYQAGSGMTAYRLGGVYRGMPACGPRPVSGGTDVLTSFPGGVSQYEWECVELAKRYLYLAYGVPAYSANGSQMVQNYSGSTLQKIYNNTPGAAPQVGDVVSYGSTSSFGHTSVVVASSGTGTGTCTNCIQVIEQNNSASGSAFLSISNWNVTGGPYPVTGWLHNPGTITPPAMPGSTSPGSTSSPGPVQPSTSVRMSWSASSNATYYSFGVRDLTTNQLVVDTTTTGTSYTAALSPGRPYRWNVAACNSAGCSSFTTPLYFQTP